MMSYDGRVNIYIKQSDRAKWDAIKDKPRFLHDAITVQHSLKVGTLYPAKAFYYKSSETYSKGITKVPGVRVIVNDSEIKE